MRCDAMKTRIIKKMKMDFVLSRERERKGVMKCNKCMKSDTKNTNVRGGRIPAVRARMKKRLDSTWR